MEDRCVICGAVIPEGRQVCKTCELANAPAPCKECQKRSETCHIYCKDYLDYYNARAHLSGAKKRENGNEEYFIRKAKRKQKYRLSRKDEYTKGG